MMMEESITSQTIGGAKFCPGDSRSWIGTTMFFTSDSGKIGGDAGSTGSSGSGARLVSVDISSSKPWDGDEPPTSIYADKTIFV